MVRTLYPTWGISYFRKRLLSSDGEVLHSVHKIFTSSKFALPLGTVCFLGLRRIIALWVSVIDCEKRFDSPLTGIDISWQPVENLGCQLCQHSWVPYSLTPEYWQAFRKLTCFTGVIWSYHGNRMAEEISAVAWLSHLVTCLNVVMSRFWRWSMILCGKIVPHLELITPLSYGIQTMGLRSI